MSALRSLRAKEVPSGDAVVAEASAEPALSPEQLKKGKSCGKMLLKSILKKLEGNKEELFGQN